MMKPLHSTMIAFLALFVSFSASAETQVTIECKESYQMDRVEETVAHTVTFDADKGSKNLSFSVYGSKITVSAAMITKEDSKTCGYEINQMCVSLKGSILCSDQSHASVYPTRKYQTVEKTTISCAIVKTKEFECPSDD